MELQFVMPILMFAIFIIVALFTFYFNNKKVLLREFNKSKRKLINAVKQGEYAKIIGTAKEGSQLLIAPLSGRPCVYYHVVVEVQNDDNWQKIINDEKHQDFFIESNSEMAIVRMSALRKPERRFHFVKDHKQRTGYRNGTSDKIEAYLERHNKKSTGLFGWNKNMRYSEGIIEPNEKIAVKGIGNWKSLNEPIEGYSYSRILELTGTKEQKLLITDEPKALLRVKNKL